MFKKLFAERPTNRTDVVMAIGGAILAAFKAWETIGKYKADQNNKEN